MSYAEWCRTMFDSLVDGGMWGVPRSGLLFTRRGDALVLTDRLPWQEGMPITKAQVREQQDGDLAAISRYMGIAGITVKDES